MATISAAAAALLAAVLLSVLPHDALGQEPGRTYVRRIEFEGVQRTADAVLRRELVQLEGTYLDNSALEQSRLSLERLPFIASAETRIEHVAGQPNVVDVVLVLRERPARRYGGGGAYSESLGPSIFGYFVNENVFGTGRQFSARAEARGIRTSLEVSSTNPYARASGVSRTISLAFRDIDRLAKNASRLEAELANVGVEYGYRAGEAQSVSFGAALRRIDIAAPSDASEQLLEWIARNGEPSEARIASLAELDVLFGWRFDTRDRTVFPTRGSEQSLSVRASLPGSDVEYYLAEYELVRHWPLGASWVARLRTVVGFGADYGAETTSIPPYLRWFAGGPRTVRGFREHSLGPRDSLGNPYGGDALVAAQFDVLRPWPGRVGDRLRVGFFFDVGNVFATDGVEFRDAGGELLDYDFDFTALRRSAGLAAQWLIPLGAVRLSYGVPLDAKERQASPFVRDDVERLQLSVGVEF